MAFEAILEKAEQLHNVGADAGYFLSVLFRDVLEQMVDQQG